jgi:hypothetical protein
MKKQKEESRKARQTAKKQRRLLRGTEPSAITADSDATTVSGAEGHAEPSKTE